MNLVGEINVPYEQNEYRTVIGEEIPWGAKFSIHTDFGVKQGMESDYQEVFSAAHLSPPNMTIIRNESHSLVVWNHTLELGEFSGLATRVTLWGEEQGSGNLSIYNQTLSTDTSILLSTETLAHDTIISLQSSVGQYSSNHTEMMGLFMPVALKHSQLNRILLIIGLTSLLIIYILATAYCLRMVKKKGSYKLKQKHQNFSPGKFSEGDHLLQHGTVKPRPMSEDGSCATEQESLVSESSLSNLIPTTPYLGESMITLNKFNDDDDFMGNFDEDGSFIGNYDEYNEEQSQAVQNKLLVFQQMYRANNGAL